MPIYAYRCEACGFAKDVLQSMSAAPLTDCESCGKPEFRKQVTAAGFQLKGSGWYVTDFRDSGKSKTTDSKGDAKAGSGGASASGDSAAGSSSAGSSSSSAYSGGSTSTPAAPATPSAPGTGA